MNHEQSQLGQTMIEEIQQCVEPHGKKQYISNSFAKVSGMAKYMLTLNILNFVQFITVLLLITSFEILFPPPTASVRPLIKFPRTSKREEQIHKGAVQMFTDINSIHK